MKVKINVYTSNYAKMLARHKNSNDCYIQVSRTLFYPKKGIDNKSIMSMIDLNYGNDLGMYENTLEEYEQRIRGEEYQNILEEIAKTFTRDFLKVNDCDFSDEEQREIEEDLKECEIAKAEIEKIISEENLKTKEDFTELKKELSNSGDKEYLEFLYLYGLDEKSLENVKQWNPCLTFNFFLLCFCDLESKYTEKDEEKFTNVKAGEKKKCHRTILAKVLNETHNLNITEW